MLTQDYLKLLRGLLLTFSENIKKTSKGEYVKKEYSIFCPSIGINFSEKRELLVFGQATNGWAYPWTIDQIENLWNKIIQESLDYSKEENGKCPLQWINDDWVKYKLYRSFFWNVIYKLIIQHYNRNDDNWTHIIAWSNLMKIAPASEGNPDDIEYEAQLKYAARLFKQELIDLKPRNVIVVTNLTWIEPILKILNIGFERTDGNYLEALAKFESSKIIITKRPFVGKHQVFVDEIGKYLI